MLEPTVIVCHAAYEQQWLTLAKEYHDHLKDMSNVPGMAGSQTPAVRDGGGESDDWRVQILRFDRAGANAHLH